MGGIISLHMVDHYVFCSNDSYYYNKMLGIWKVTSYDKDKIISILS